MVAIILIPMRIVLKVKAGSLLVLAPVCDNGDGCEGDDEDPDDDDPHVDKVKGEH